MKEIYHFIHKKNQTNFKILQMITNSVIQYYLHLGTDFIRFLDYTMILRSILTIHLGTKNFGRLALLKMII